MHYLFIKERLN